MPHPEAAPTPSLTLLLPRLSSWIPQLSSNARYPALELILARGQRSAPLASAIDSLRMQLFGVPWQGETPVAALELLAAGRIEKDDHSYHLRIDPVILQADMTRVMMVKSGFGGFTAEYRRTVGNALQEVFEDAGMTLEPAAGSVGPENESIEHWTVSLPDHPGVIFTSLDEALGADISEHLPDGNDGRLWRRLANEMQMALHSLPSNERLRERGVASINGAWFWGGGRLPAAGESRQFDRVFSSDPVSRGLARLQQSRVDTLERWQQGSLQAQRASHNEAQSLAEVLSHDRVLVDWAIPASTATEDLLVTPDKLEAACDEALAGMRKHRGRLELQTPEFRLTLQATDLRAFWRRPKPLASQLAGLLQSLAPSQ